MIKQIIDKNSEVKPNSKKLEALKEYFAGCFTKEGAFDIERFKDMMKDEVDISNEGYSLDFLGKDYANLIASIDTTTVIEPDLEHNAKPENKDSENIYISGDNLDALKHLLKSYAGKVKCIYIDPPYNTGSDGFVYNDKFRFTPEELEKKLSIDEDEAQRILDLTSRGSSTHSAWLMFMSPRLQLARELLSKDGVIFISIDDNEQANLKLLCDYVFGEENCIGPFIQNKLNSKNDTLNIQKNHEFIYCYRKAIIEKNSKIQPTLGRQSYVEKTIYEENGEFLYLNDPITTRGEGGTLNNRENLGYTFYYNPISKDVKVVEDYDKELAKVSNEESEVYSDNEELIAQGYITIRPPRVRGDLGAWTWEFDRAKDSKELMVKKLANSKSYTIVKKTFVPKEDVYDVDGQLKYLKYTISNSKSILDFSTNDGTTTFNEVMGRSGLFSNPKNVSMLNYLISLIDSKEFIVCDFFGGSSSTAHAVMNLNKEDNGNRKFILVQIPEIIEEEKVAYKAGYRTIDEIGIERIERVAEKIKEEKTDFNGDLGFKHYTLRDVPENVLDKIIEFDPNTSGFANNLLEMFGRETVLETWKVRDGYGMNVKVEEVALADYTAYQCGDHLYLTDEGMSDEAVTALVDKYGEQSDWGPHYVVLFGYSFNFGTTDALKKNLPLLNEGEKQIKINIDIRY